LKCKKRNRLELCINRKNPLFIELQPDTKYDLQNPHPRAVKELLQDKNYHPRNIHPKIVKKHIEHVIFDSFSENSSDLAVDYLLGCPDKIYWFWFVCNMNPRAIDFIIQKWDEISTINQEWFSANWSQKAFNWLLQNQKFINYTRIKENPFNWEVNRLKYVQSKRLLVRTTM
jgi:hypothetical protein